ncbi:hypothetical protein QTP86_030957 [Hemibagrus guttatus]|nr:hypothetical protein QTP86_030957 [Hemibagrus guttatus]
MGEAAGHEGWPQRDWVDMLAPLLTGEAKLAYYSLEEEDAWDYDKSRKPIGKVGKLRVAPLRALSMSPMSTKNTSAHGGGHQPCSAYGPPPDTKIGRDISSLVHSWQAAYLGGELWMRAERGRPAEALLGTGATSGRCEHWPRRPAPCVLVKEGLLYYHMECCGKPCNLLVIPYTRNTLFIPLASTQPLEGHLGPKNTLVKGPLHMARDAGRVRCQRTVPQKPVVGPLILSSSLASHLNELAWIS